jgi:hypothetical protein
MSMDTFEEWIPAGVYPREIGGGNDKTSTAPKKKLWGEHFWSPSYCSVTCGGAPLEIIKKYIENQRKPSSEKGVAQSIRERKVRLRVDDNR